MVEEEREGVAAPSPNMGTDDTQSQVLSQNHLPSFQPRLASDVESDPDLDLAKIIQSDLEKHHNQSSKTTQSVESKEIYHQRKSSHHKQFNQFKNHLSAQCLPPPKSSA